VCRHDCFSFRRVRSTLSRMGIDEIDMRAYLAPRGSPGDSTPRSTDARRVHWRSWLLVRGGRGLFSHLEGLRAHSFLDPSVADSEEAETVGAIGVWSGLEGAADLVDPKRIVED